MVLAMKIKPYLTGELQENAYLLTDEATGKIAVIDPGAPDQVLMDAIHAVKDSIAVILLTHGHFDHIGAVEEIQRLTGAPVYAAGEELDMLADSRKNLSAMFGTPIVIRDAHPLHDGEQIQLGTLMIEVIHTPGHSMGGMCFLADNALFTGDTLFAGSVGRTDFWGGDGSMLMHSVQRLAQLPGDYRVLPGHGEETTLARERVYNPYCREESQF